MSTSRQTESPAHGNARCVPEVLRYGLTLMEMVVILAILAAMATAATVAAERVLYQRRFELTRDTLESLGSAVLGKSEPAQAGKPAVSLDGFVADLGRLPLAWGTDLGMQSIELWANPRALEPYGRKQADADPEVHLNCGWRGPYLELPLGATTLTDGWGRPFVPLVVDSAGTSNPAAANDPIAGWLSFGSDGTAGVGATNPLPLSQDLSRALWTLNGTEFSRLWTANVTVVINQTPSGGGAATTPEGSGTLTVVLFAPNPNDGRVAAFTMSLDGPFATPPSFTFPTVAIGPKVIRARYQTTATVKTAPVDIEVTRTGTTSWTLTLPASPSGGP